MAAWIQALSILNFFILSSKAETFQYFQSDTELNQQTINPENGIVYVGAINRLYQLSADLGLQVNVSTGPRLDLKTCTPPIDISQCSHATLTDNYNKLLLLDGPNDRIVVCGSIFKGICSLRKAVNISAEISYDDSKGEKSFVASNDENISTVGLVTNLTVVKMSETLRVLFVGKGNGQSDNGIIISTRLLDEYGDRGPFETYVDSTAFKSAALSFTFQQFVTAFEDDRYVFFISTRLEKSTGRNKTLISRMCKYDPNYYSYIEMDLECKDNQHDYNFCHSFFITTPGEELARVMNKSPEEGKFLFGVYSKNGKESVSERSALCVFSLKDINAKFEYNREACYTSKESTVMKNGIKIFYKPYGADIQCGGLAKDAVINYPCGQEHLPYPLESRDGVVTSPVLVLEKNTFTTVAVAVEEEHTIAFLGTNDGKLVKSSLSPVIKENVSIFSPR
ncbi:plexin-B2 [Bombina bombina]|uniref:plexin-B2 n=1 Tax=Bombina bombina TaxID=8345 RepID=UPI00235A8EF9|nr:plexin-B2 [Bombina bombina]